jgi:hypothetical protein
MFGGVVDDLDNLDYAINYWFQSNHLIAVMNLWLTIDWVVSGGFVLETYFLKL